LYSATIHKNTKSNKTIFFAILLWLNIVIFFINYWTNGKAQIRLIRSMKMLNKFLILVINWLFIYIFIELIYIILLLSRFNNLNLSMKSQAASNYFTGSTTSHKEQSSKTLESQNLYKKI
jgi:hypothetical protein